MALAVFRYLPTLIPPATYGFRSSGLDGQADATACIPRTAGSEAGLVLILILMPLASTFSKLLDRVGMIWKLERVFVCFVIAQECLLPTHRKLGDAIAQHLLSNQIFRNRRKGHCV